VGPERSEGASRSRKRGERIHEGVPSGARATLASRAAKVRLLVLDVDGVLTDGRLLYGPAGEEVKRFHVRDGFALVAARGAGLAVAVISGRASAAVTRRMAELGVDEVHQGVDDKRRCLDELRARLGMARGQVAAMGDDLPDLPLLREAGLALAPADAAAEIRRVAHWTSRHPGGRGAVREAVEMLLGARKAWPPPISASR
jgi:3-deoxy-D-manno-octulosonate 8-phosphate phosphatase (KDO 8-P phosphatase)